MLTASIRILATALAASLFIGCASSTLPATPKATSIAGPSAATPIGTPGPTTVGPSPATGPDPCRLVTQAEVQHAAALPFVAGRRDGSDCDFDGDKSQGNEMTIVVAIDNANNVSGARREFADGHTVTGLGNDAWWSPSITELWVDLGGGRTLQVQIVPIDLPLDQDFFPIAQTLAKLAISRL